MKAFQLIVGVLVCAFLALPSARPARALDAGQAAPEIRLNDLQGKPVSLSSLRGKVVIVDFWASWCGPCKQSMPVLERLSKSYRDRGLVVLGVNIDDDVKTAAKFLAEVPVSFVVVNDRDKRVAKAYAPPTMPSSYLIDRDGRVRQVHAGFKAADAKLLETEVQRLLK
jgi:cytochrome c biogenesis protein CcmG/thiol:disulfide interchange protein DsbE